jgi:hypothetical protein
MKRVVNPFPPPCIRHSGSCNLWDSEEIAAWELRERALTRSAPELITHKTGDANDIENRAPGASLSR